MTGLDKLIADLGNGRSPLVVLAVALLLGLRHASDPDHLVAVSTLVAGERERPVRRAAGLGLSWGLGHASTVVALGLPIVLFHRFLPARISSAAEVAIGLVIVALAVRLLLRWRRGMFHVHEHAHDGVAHRHLHRHDESREHAHRHVVVRSRAQAYGIGLVHGVGGSAAVGVLLLASIGDRTEALVALGLFAFGTACSMAALSALFGCALGTAPVHRRLASAAPALGLLSLAFGLWYAVGAAAAF